MDPQWVGSCCCLSLGSLPAGLQTLLFANPDQLMEREGHRSCQREAKGSEEKTDLQGMVHTAQDHAAEPGFAGNSSQGQQHEHSSQAGLLMMEGLKKCRLSTTLNHVHSLCPSRVPRVSTRSQG